MLKYLAHKLKTQSINEENPNEKVSERKFGKQRHFLTRAASFFSYYTTECLRECTYGKKIVCDMPKNEKLRDREIHDS